MRKEEREVKEWMTSLRGDQRRHEKEEKMERKVWQVRK